jgi:hypothetical protein
MQNDAQREFVFETYYPIFELLESAGIDSLLLPKHELERLEKAVQSCFVCGKSLPTPDSVAIKKTWNQGIQCYCLNCYRRG